MFSIKQKPEIVLNCLNLKRSFWRRQFMVLGIETSCDDTGLAVLNSNGKVLSNVLNSQQQKHTRYGGIIPPVAQNLHRSCIADNFEKCIDLAGINPEALHAIAVTTQPGLPLCLTVGLRFAKHIARKYRKPIIPVHHMEAHALQASMEHDIAFPFLCLLISGGHCQLVLVKNPLSFSLLGETRDDAPGELLDKIARRLRLSLIPKYRSSNGGSSIEDAAKAALGNENEQFYPYPMPLMQLRNCNFSFAGLKNHTTNIIKDCERTQKTAPDDVISTHSNICAGLLLACTRHLMHRTQRALDYCVEHCLFGNAQPTLVISGGVANNNVIFANMIHLGETYNCNVFRPSRAFCSDNGVMIAWNGVQKLKYCGDDCLIWDFDELTVKHKAPYNEDLRITVEAENIKCKWVQPLKCFDP